MAPRSIIRFVEKNFFTRWNPVLFSRKKQAGNNILLPTKKDVVKLRNQILRGSKPFSAYTVIRLLSLNFGEILQPETYHFNRLSEKTGRNSDIFFLNQDNQSTASTSVSFRRNGRIQISVCDRVDNIVGKGENAGYQHFLLFPQYSQKASSSGSSKVGIVW